MSLSVHNVFGANKNTNYFKNSYWIISKYEKNINLRLANNNDSLKDNWHSFQAMPQSVGEKK